MTINHLQTLKKTVIFICLLLFYPGIIKSQSSWILDPSFGDNGITRINFGTNNNDTPNDILLLPGDKILTAGISVSSSSGGYFIAMSQLLPNGQPDLSDFGTDGEVLLHFVLRDHANDIERQPDGKILVVGAEAVGNGVSQITPALYRFNSDGTLDTAFADSGKAVHRFPGDSPGELYGVKILPDGRILTAGYSNGGGLAGFGAMRFLPNGELDLNFGTNGKARINYGATAFYHMGCLFLADTAIVMVIVPLSNKFVLAMMDSSGNPYTSFGNNGIVETNIDAKFDAHSGGESLALTDDGKILLSGTTPNSSPTKFTVFRFLTNGTIDSTFGTDGRTDIQFTSDDVCYDMKLDADGKILLVGRVSQGNGIAGLARLNPDGTPDTTFAPDGKFILDLNNNSGTHYLTTCLPLPNGDILAAGYDFASNAGDFMVLRLTQVATGIEETNDELPKEFILHQNYPNPFNPSTKISWQSPVGSQQILKVYDVLGNEVVTLVDEFKPAGRYEVEFKSTVGSLQLASGIYFYRIQAGSFVSTKKMILLR